MQRSQALKGVIPDALIPLIPTRYELIGDIAVISFSDELTPYQTEIARSLIATRPRVTTVLRRVSKRKGSSRIARYEPIIGTKMNSTYRESGFKYRVDLSQAFFTTRLAGEHQRISAMVHADETVLVPFAGVGPFVIPVTSQGATVIAIEKNPAACQLLRENIALNNLTDRVLMLRGDAVFVDQMLDCQVDRAIIPTPYGLDQALIPISKMVKPGGMIHFYTFHNRKEADDLSKRFERCGFVISRIHRCGNIAPSVNRWVFDMKRPEFIPGDLNIFTTCE